MLVAPAGVVVGGHDGILRGAPGDRACAVCVFRRIVTARFGIVTAEFGSVTEHFGSVTD
jgi:hypothetical protein